MKRFSFTRDELQFMQHNYKKLTNDDLLKHINNNRPANNHMSMTTFRALKKKNNFTRYGPAGWTPDKVNYLLNHYAQMGNVEIGQKLGFSKKQIEKKIKLLKLKRTPEMLQNIFNRNKASGRLAIANTKRWQKTGVHPEGARIIRKQQDGKLNEYIKVNGWFIPYARYAYEQAYGALPCNYIVLHYDCNRLNNALSNLYAVPRKGLSAECRAKYAQQDFKNLMIHKPVAQSTESKPIKPQLAPQGIPVRIDAKTIVYVKPGTNIENLRNKFAERMAVI